MQVQPCPGLRAILVLCGPVRVRHGSRATAPYGHPAVRTRSSLHLSVARPVSILSGPCVFWCDECGLAGDIYQDGSDLDCMQALSWPISANGREL